MYQVCTCGKAYLSVLPPDPCPVHGHMQMGRTYTFSHAWECPRCKAMNGPLVERCTCTPQAFTAADLKAGLTD